MSWLFLDTHETGHFRYGWFLSNVRGIHVQVKTVHARSHVLLSYLQKIWKQPNEFSGICVVTGPGAFSSTRVGVLYANLLSRLMSKPLVGVTEQEAAALPELAQKLFQGAYRPASYVAPQYLAEPNITFPTRP